MCGITGIINFNKNIEGNKYIIENMNKTLTKRGPDNSGYYTSKNVLLGHNRLIVVDPVGGSQPMIKTINDNDYVIVYNGELYNTEDIRKDLINKGFIFESYSDTEVLLSAYICYGNDFLSKLNGIFAFAIYDSKNEQVILARDQMGVKPLFYSIIDNELIFGSEIKALLENPKVKPVVDRDGLTALFSLGPAVKPGTCIYRDIKEIKPAEFLLFKKDNVRIDKYWTLEAVPHTESLDETIEHTKNLLIDAVKRQLVGDVPLCTFLSGGLDSSAISAIAASEYSRKGKKLTTYSIDYEDNDKYFKASLFQPTSDQYWAEEMAKFINSDHRTVLLNHEELEKSLKDAVIGRDLPGMADVDSSLLLFCKKVQEDFVIALSGECADELFGGYPWFTRDELINSNTFPWARFVKDRYAILNSDLKKLKIEEYANECYLDTLKSTPHLPNESKEEHRMRELFVLNTNWFMLTLLNRKDRMSMINSLEVRVPFADHRIVQYAFNIPKNIKLLKGREKGLLRKSLEGILPEDIIYRKKSPYPKTHNPIYTTLVCNEMKSILNDSSSPILDLIDINTVSEIVNSEGASYKTPWYGQLMTGPQLIAYLIQINHWLKEYKIELK